ncbi:YbaB/EbfC family nucleoid-associated protein [Mycolicibacterium sp.]|uniref:YbaB/EbfC family nucleoid-associated protein n=1 Tax=Mycolicibacterium sp. TaxID=2320850 RepID=UPI003D13F203
MSDDSARHLFADAMGLLQEQMREMAEIEERRATLTAKGTAADGTVEVSVDPQGMVSGVAIDESYLDDYEFDELGGHILAAAQAAARDMERQSRELLAPLVERRMALTDLSTSIGDAPQFSEMLSALTSWSPDTGPVDLAPSGEGSDGQSSFPMVRE